MAKRETKYKDTMNVVGRNRIQMTCSCGWAGSVMIGDTDLSFTMATARSEYQSHTHIPKVKKPRKKREK